MRDGEIFISKLRCISLISVLRFALLASSTGCFFLFLMVGKADMMLRSKVCIADAAPFFFNLQPHFKFCAKHTFKLQIRGGWREMGGGWCWDVNCAGGLKKTEGNKMSACCRIHLGSWRNTVVGNSFFRVLSPSWSRQNVLQPPQLGSVGQNTPLNLLGVLPLLQSHHWERQSHVQALPLSPILSGLVSALPSRFLTRGWASIDAENTLPLWDTYLNLMEWKPQVLTLRTFPSLGDTDRGNLLFRSLMVPGPGSCKQPLFLLDASDAK